MSWLPVLIPVIFILGLFVLVYGRMFLQLLGDRKRAKQFKEFENVLSGVESDPHKTEKFFSGEVKIQQEVYILIPEEIVAQDRIERFENPIAEALAATELGEIVRGFTSDGTCGIDVFLIDFVNGVDLLRKLLVQLKSPMGTLIEYDGGDLPIYDD